MLIWADETFSVTQDGFKREGFLVDCNGQMYDHDIIVFASQTFKLLDDPEWTVPFPNGSKAVEFQLKSHVFSEL